MKLEKEDYLDPSCPLCGKPGETEPVQPIPMERVMGRLREMEDRNDWPAVEKHLRYWLAEAEAGLNERAQLTLHNELMGFYRKQGQKDPAFTHAAQAVALVEKLGLVFTVSSVIIATFSPLIKGKTRSENASNSSVIVTV